MLQCTDSWATFILGYLDAKDIQACWDAVPFF